MEPDNLKNASEEPSPQVKSPPVTVMTASPRLLRAFELLLSLLCFCLVVVPYDNRLQASVHRGGVIYTAFLASIMHNLVFLVAHFSKVPTPKFMGYLTSVLDGCLLLVAGYLLVTDWWALIHSLFFHPPKMFTDMILCAGVFSLFNSFVSFVDIYISYKYF